ncbi:methyltransferase domain-containing protein [Chitinophaga pendula]|uniref:class I SAM-dependent methyltransferase n=1 Tax=Chitinophaga TaxID=79328 RepID=UPI000BAE804A|nr:MULTISPECIES: class I SAM-dependent methyltransferase [Chitinophaga]ASZ14914.1 SAM-dependent methyltransferase [Chitinophaga sp. MD30]UCJ05371.1 methyltransferase domain-containing protein [Chitinophaga pendula]
MEHWNATLYKEKHSFVFEYGNSLLEWLQPLAGEQILDLGCGTGELTAKLADAGALVTGLDNDGEMIASARAQYPGLDLVVADAAGFSLPGVYDAVFSNAALHWMPDARAVIAGMYRHLKPGGRLILEMGAKGNVGGILHALEKVMALHGYEYQAFWYFPSLSEYSTLLEEAGFVVRKAYFFDRPTVLSDPENGIVEWLRMFGERIFSDVPVEKQEVILRETQQLLYDTHYKDGKWYADYVRLRVHAEK